VNTPTTSHNDDTFERGVAVLRSRQLLMRRRPSAVPASLPADRVAGALLGLAAGNSLGALVQRERRQHGGAGTPSISLLKATALTRSGSPVTALTRQAVLSGRTWSRGARQAPRRLSDRLVAEHGQHRHAGRATSAMVARRLKGMAWFDAGVASFGNGALGRATAPAFLTLADTAPEAVALDTAVTHAHPLATATSVLYADVLIELTCRDAGWSWLEDVANRATHPRLRATLLTAADLDGAPTQVAMARLGAGIDAPTTLATALWLLCAHPGDGAGAVAEAARWLGDPATLAAITGALVGARDGVDAFPSHWTAHVELGRELRKLADRAAAQWPQKAHGDADQEQRNALWFLLDRSGSMASIAQDVVGGFDQFFADQRSQSGDLAVTLVQFDSADVHDVVFDAVDVSAVPSLRGRFQPRGSTPLYDALGLLLDRAEAAGGVGADQLVVVFTDGMENASRRWTRDRLFDRIERLKADGWTFVFLGANQDSYAAGGAIGMASGNTSNFLPDAAGLDLAYTGLSRATFEWRAKDRFRRHADRDEFWGGVKEAEELSR
jgi:ADP-ribosylglycohydrolase